MDKKPSTQTIILTGIESGEVVSSGFKMMREVINLPRPKRKPGPKPLTAAEKINLVMDFRASGKSQQAFCDLRILGLNKLKNAIKWYEARFENS